ncbi:MAG TPA: hypothetical protein VFP37_11735 [Steroidobacteraceae bacterium]|nr:hypothetical protein [Steroidobacteraceae bacterium]
MIIGYLLLLASVVFWPIFIVALAFLRFSAVRAFVLAGTFTLGAVVGAALSLAAAVPLIPREVGGDAHDYYVFAFVSLGAVGGGVLAAFLLGKLSGQSLWRRP